MNTNDTQEFPTAVPVVVVEQAVFYPGMGFPIRIDDPVHQKAVDLARSRFDGFFLLAASLEKASERSSVDMDGVARFGVLAHVDELVTAKDGAYHLYVRVFCRAVAKAWHHEQPALADVSYPEEENSDPARTTVLFEKTRELLAELLEFLPSNNDTELLKRTLKATDAPGRLADYIAANIGMKEAERQHVLETLDLTDRMEQVLLVVAADLEMRKLGQKIQGEVKEKVEKRHRDFMLREQLSAIRKELGDEQDDMQSAEERYEERISSGGLSQEAADKARKELERLKKLTPDSAEHNVVRTYLDTMLDLPWGRRTSDKLDLKHARRVLERDHHALEGVKERITEFLAVQKLTSHRTEKRGPILCLSGPPGVGKTSLGKSIADALGRNFYRFSLGGMRDEAEIKGHRRTYVGAMPGKILQAMSRAGTANPVILLDEIDKLGHDWRGDPSSAMLEVLDPEQNHAFLDHYLDVPYDLSEVFFICTANVKEDIPRPLLDRMEVIDIPSYTDIEKVEIARRHLLPRQRDAHGLTGRHLGIARDGLFKIVHDYTREAGVRNLERAIARVCRKVAGKVADGATNTSRVTASSLHEYLGQPRFKSDAVLRVERPGVAIGLAWTPVGGETLSIETSQMPGTGRVNLTGKLGDVMNESAHLALSYLRSNSDRYGFALGDLTKTDIHVHVPAGAIPKDGPSAGVTIATALYSLFSGRCLKPSLAMTGELTLTGRVLAVGGIREKVMAAHRQGIRRVIIPRDNLSDLEEVPEQVRAEMTFVPAEHFEDVARAAFGAAALVARSEPIVEVRASA